MTARLATFIACAALVALPCAARAQAGGGEPPAERELPGRAISLHAASGFGAGSLTFTRPTATGEQHLAETAFAAAELMLRVHIAPAQALSFEAQLAYQTSLGLELELRPLFALPERVAARVQRVELSVAPRLRLARGARAVAIAAPIGASLRSFFPKLHQYSVAAHELGALFIRPELIVPIGELIALRAGPELHWLARIDPALERQGATGFGYALGGSATLEARIGAAFSLAIAYRELRSTIPAAARFEDAERFLTVRLGGGL